MQSPEMPMSNKTSSHKMENNSSQEEVSTHNESSSDQEQDEEVPRIYMPYIDGPTMDWTVNDSLYHRFLKWK